MQQAIGLLCFWPITTMPGAYDIPDSMVLCFIHFAMCQRYNIMHWTWVELHSVTCALCDYRSHSMTEHEPVQSPCMRPYLRPGQGVTD